MYSWLAIGGGIGIVVGLVIAKAMGGNKVAEAMAELDRVRSKAADEQNRTKAEATKAADQVKQAETKIQSATTELQAAQKKLQAIEADKKKVEQQSEGHQKARQQAEGRLKQAEKLTEDSRKQVEAAKAELDTVRKEYDAFKKSTADDAAEIRRLRADLAATGKEGSAATDNAFADANGSLDKVLETLLDKEGQRAAVLADSNGIVIASAGDKDLRDGLAAAAELLSKVGGQFGGVIPLGTVRGFSLADAESLVLSGRAFDAAGEKLALATYGSRRPNEQILDGAMASLSSALE